MYIFWLHTIISGFCFYHIFRAVYILSTEFAVYLDSAIEAQESNSVSENLLVTVKLRLLDEQGER